MCLILESSLPGLDPGSRGKGWKTHIFLAAVTLDPGSALTLVRGVNIFKPQHDPFVSRYPSALPAARALLSRAP